MIFKSILGGVLFSLILVSTSHLALADEAADKARDVEKCIANLSDAAGIETSTSRDFCSKIEAQNLSNSTAFKNCIHVFRDAKPTSPGLWLLSDCIKQSNRDLAGDPQFAVCVKDLTAEGDLLSDSHCSDFNIRQASKDPAYLSCVRIQHELGDSIAEAQCAKNKVRIGANKASYEDCFEHLKQIGVERYEAMDFCIDDSTYHGRSQDPRFYACVKAVTRVTKDHYPRRYEFISNLSLSAGVKYCANHPELLEFDMFDNSMFPEFYPTDFATLADGLNPSTSTLVPTQNAEAVRERSVEESAQAIKQVVDGVKKFLTPAQSVKQTGKSVRVK